MLVQFRRVQTLTLIAPSATRYAVKVAMSAMTRYVSLLTDLALNGAELLCSVSHQPAMGMQEIKERLAAQAGKSPTRAELARGARNRLRTKLVNEDASCTRGP